MKNNFEPHSDNGPDEEAMSLYTQGITSIEYKELQWEREKRLLFFKSKGIPVLIEHSQRLVDYGKNVYDNLVELEQSVESWDQVISIIMTGAGQDDYSKEFRNQMIELLSSAFEIKFKPEPLQ